MESTSSSSISYGPRRDSVGFRLENPFTFKIGQVFTGVGVGCGVGIGVGKPIYLGAIPMLQPVLSATRGATDVFSGVGRHVNSSLKKVGLKNIEAGVGCGVGIGHGFGVGLAIKPGVIHGIQSAIGQALAKIMMNLGVVPNLSSFQNIIPGSAQSGMGMLTAASSRNVQTSIGNQLGLTSLTTGSRLQDSRSHGSSHESVHDSYESEVTPSEQSLGSRTEKVINNFLQTPILKNQEESELDQLASKFRSENNMLQILMKHQQLIEELIDENEKLRQILQEDLKVQPSKLERSAESRMKLNNACSNCFECRRRNRKSSR